MQLSQSRITELLALLDTTGGFSESISQLGQPSGYMVGGIVKPFKCFYPMVDGALIARAFEYMVLPEHDLFYFGGWIDNNNYMHFDIVEDIEMLSQARQIAKSRNEVAIYDVVRQRSIYVN